MIITDDKIRRLLASKDYVGLEAAFFEDALDHISDEVLVETIYALSVSEERAVRYALHVVFKSGAVSKLAEADLLESTISSLIDDAPAGAQYTLKVIFKSGAVSKLAEADLLESTIRSMVTNNTDLSLDALYHAFDNGVIEHISHAGLDELIRCVSRSNKDNSRHIIESAFKNGAAMKLFSSRLLDDLRKFLSTLDTRSSALAIFKIDEFATGRSGGPIANFCVESNVPAVVLGEISPIKDHLQVGFKLDLF